MDEGCMAEVRAETLKHEREEVYVAFQYAASLSPKPKEKWSFFNERSERMKHRTEWCAEANRYRCMRCGKGSNYMKMAGKCTGPQFIRKVWDNEEDAMWEVMTSSEDWTDRERYQHGGVSVRLYARQRMGPKQVICCKLEQMGTTRIWQNDEKNPNSRKEESQPKRQRIGESREKRKELRERSIRGC